VSSDVEPLSPRVSVVMPVLNGAATLPQQLRALAAQTYPGRWELVVADNGSTDETAQVVREWTGRLPCLRLVDASDRMSTNYARNVRTLTADAINAAGKKIIHPDEVIWVIVGDLKKVEAGIRELNLGEVVRVDNLAVAAVADTALGHKLALLALGAGDKVIKYGMPIGSMTRPAVPGDWVHMHNMQSDYMPAHLRDAT